MLIDIDDDEDMYDDEYEDEMDYEEGPMSEDREEDVSDEDEEEAELNGMGPIEGLPGDLGVVEVTMDEDDDEEDDEMDEDDEDGSEDDDELGSDDMDDDDDRIEIIDDEGNPLEDDGASAWESESVEEEDEDDEIDFEAEAQDLDEAPIHGLDDIDEPPPRFGDIMRAIEQDFSIDDINGINERPFTADDDEDGRLPLMVIRHILCTLLTSIQKTKMMKRTTNMPTKTNTLVGSILL